MRGALTARNAITASPWSAGRLPLVSLASGFAADGERAQLDGLDAALGDAGRVTSAAEASIAAPRPGSLRYATWTSHRIVTDLKPTRLAGAFAGRMRVDTADADGEISGDLKQSGWRRLLRAAVARGVVDVEHLPRTGRGGTLQGTASFAMAGTRAFKVSRNRATALNPASFGNYRSHRCTGRPARRARSGPAWSAAISFELGRDSTCADVRSPEPARSHFARQRRDAHIELSAGANQARTP